MIRTFESMRQVQPGFRQPAALETFRLSIPLSVAPNDTAMRVLQQSIVDRLAGVPGVTTVSLIDGLPMTDFRSQDPIYASDRAYDADKIPPLRRFLRAAPGTFATLGTPLIAGREFDWNDIHQERPVVIIGENVARDLWGIGTGRPRTADPCESHRPLV